MWGRAVVNFKAFSHRSLSGEFLVFRILMIRVDAAQLWSLAASTEGNNKQ